MAKTNRPRRRMDRYFKNVQRNTYILSCNKKGLCTTKIRKWDVIRKLTKKLVPEDDRASTKMSKKDPRNSEPVVQLLPRQDVMLYGIIPKMEQRIYSKCRECCRVFNPRDVLSHRNCIKSAHSSDPNILKKKVKSKGSSSSSSNSKKASSEATLSANSSSNSNNTTVSTSSPLVKDFVFKKPFPPPPLSSGTPPPMPQLKVSVTKIGLTKVTKATTVTSSSASTPTTSSDKSDSRASSSKVSSSVHHSPRTTSSSHGSKSSSSSHHSPKGPSSSHHSHSTRTSSSSSSSSSSHSPKSPSSSSLPHSPRTPSKSSSHHASSSSSSHHIHHSSRSSSSSSSKSTPMDTLPPSSGTSPSSSHYHHSSSSSSSHSSSRHRKSSSSSSSSKRSGGSSSSSSSSSSTKFLPKDYDPDFNCGVVEGSRGPCMRSITCSSHRIQLRKLVPGRSKDIHQLIAERKAAKEKDLKHSTPPCSYTPPNGEAKEILSQNTSFVPVVAKIVSTTSIDSATPSTTSYVPIISRVSGHHTRQSAAAAAAATLLSKNMVENEKYSTKALTNGYLACAKNLDNTQDNVVGTVPVLIMSPVSVVSPVQLLKIGNNIISLESPQSAMSPPLKKQTVILPISSSHSTNVEMYKSHPKPVVFPNFGARNVGGAILLTDPRLKSQRNKLLSALSKGREIESKDCKRPASDKLVTSDSKRLDVNGFILHADVSETADAPQSNNCIQEKIALLNMK